MQQSFADNLFHKLSSENSVLAKLVEYIIHYSIYAIRHIVTLVIGNKDILIVNVDYRFI